MSNGEKIEKENENKEWMTFKARLQKLRRIAIRKQIAEKLGIKQGDLVEIKVRKVDPEELLKHRD